MVTVDEKISSFEETFNKLRTFSSLDIMSQFSATAQGEVLGIGGSVTNTSSIHAHTEVETEKFNRTKREKIIEDSVVLDYPGPVLYENDVFQDYPRPGLGPEDQLVHRKGSVQYPGEVWLIERPVVTLQTTTPMTQWGVWDCGILHLNVYDWAGNYGALPDGKHKNELELNGLGELLDLMKGNLVLQYKWSSKYKPSPRKSERLALQVAGRREPSAGRAGRVGSRPTE